MEDVLKIMEWNIGKIDVDMKEARYDCLVNEIINQKADVVVLTEMTREQSKLLNRLLGHEECNYAYAATSNQTPNGIAIIVSKEKVNKVFFEDIITYKKGGENEEKEIYPDVLLANLYLKNNKTVCIMGTRFRNSGLTGKERKLQIDKFVECVKKYQPRLIIGDFNWDSAIAGTLESIKENPEEMFCKMLRFNGKSKENTKRTQFQMWPSSEEIKEKELCSYIPVKNRDKTTCPDRVIYDNTVYDWKEGKEGKYSWVKDENENRLFDHAILTCTLKIKNSCI